MSDSDIEIIEPELEPDQASNATGAFFAGLLAEKPLDPILLSGIDEECEPNVLAALVDTKQKEVESNAVACYYMDQIEGRRCFRYASESRMCATALLCFLRANPSLLDADSFNPPDNVPNAAVGFPFPAESTGSLSQPDITKELIRSYGRGYKTGQLISNNTAPTVQTCKASDESVSATSKVMTRKNSGVKRNSSGQMSVKPDSDSNYAVEMAKRTFGLQTNAAYRVRLFTLHALTRDGETDWYQMSEPLIYYLSTHSYIGRPYLMVKYKPKLDVKNSFRAKVESGATFSAARKRNLAEVSTESLPTEGIHPSDVLSDREMKYIADQTPDRVKQKSGRRAYKEIDMSHPNLATWAKCAQESKIDRLLLMAPEMKGLCYRLMTDDHLKDDVILGVDWCFGVGGSHAFVMTVTNPYLLKKKSTAAVGFSDPLDKRGEAVGCVIAVALAARHDEESVAWALESVERSIFEYGRHELGGTKRPTVAITLSDDEKGILNGLKRVRMTRDAVHRQCVHHFTANVMEKCRATGVGASAANGIRRLVFGSVSTCTQLMDCRLDGYIHKSVAEQQHAQDDLVESVIEYIRQENDDEGTVNDWRRYLHHHLLPRCRKSFNGHIPLEQKMYACTLYNNLTEAYNRVLKMNTNDLMGGFDSVADGCSTTFKEQLLQFRFALFYADGAVAAAKYKLSPYGAAVKARAIETAGASSSHNQTCVVAKTFGLKATERKPTCLDEKHWNELIDRREQILTTHELHVTVLPSAGRDGHEVKVLTFQQKPNVKQLSVPMQGNIFTVGEEKLGSGVSFYTCLNSNHSRPCDFFESPNVTADKKAPKRMNIFVCMHTVCAYESVDDAAAAVQEKIDSEPARVARLSMQARGSGQKGNTSDGSNGKLRRERPTPAHQQRQMMITLDPFHSPHDAAYWQLARPWNSKAVDGAYGKIQCNQYSLLICHWGHVDTQGQPGSGDSMVTYQTAHVKSCANKICPDKHFTLHETGEKGLFAAHYESYEYGALRDRRQSSAWRLLHATQHDIVTHLPNVTCTALPEYPEHEYVVLSKSLHKELLRNMREGNTSQSATRVTNWLASQFDIDIAQVMDDGETLRYSTNRGRFPDKQRELVDFWNVDDYDFD